MALYGVRRSLERGANRDRSPARLSMAMSAGVVRDLLELIDALDRRVPQIRRAGETTIARDAAALKARALKRIEELERDELLTEQI